MAGRHASADDVGRLRPLCKQCLAQIGPEALCSKGCFTPRKDEHKRADRKLVQITYGRRTTLEESRRGTPVCSVCLRELPEELRSLSKVVCRRAEHSTYFKQGFRWMTPSPSDAIIRPTPFNVFHMSQRGQKYRNNHTYQSCDRSRKGYSKDECIFPHSQVEEQWWNQWQEKSIDEIALTHVGKQLYIKSRNESQQKSVVRVQPEQKSVYDTNPPEATSAPALAQQLLHGVLTAANYKSRFRKLMYLEMEQIKNRLRTDVGQCGHCRYGHLNFQVSMVTYNSLTLTMSSETGEFVKQSSQDVVLSCCQIGQPMLVLKAVIIDAKDGLKMRVLPIAIEGINTEQQLQKIMRGKYICATFKPHLTYWESLHNAIEGLPSRIISQILFPVERDFNVDGRYRKDLAHYKPHDQMLELDDLYQTDALNAALRCPPGPPFLLTGPFGTGKTRLIARFAHQILHARGRARVLICVHHIQTADSYLDSFFLKMQSHLPPCEPVRLLGEMEQKPSERFFTPERYAKDRYYKTIAEIAEAEEKPRLVVATTGAAMQLKKLYKQDGFTHIFIDEAAQCIEPEAIVPLHLAGKYTKVLLAGDHLQVGPDDAVQCREAKDNGLGVSLLSRLHSLYLQLEKDSRVADNPFIKCFTSSLLSNYRCDPGILRLPSNLFYESSLLPQVYYKQHPDVNYPLVFICTSMAQNLHLEPKKEVMTMLELAESLANHWPMEWKKYGDSDALCLMARTYHQLDQLRRQMRNRFQSLEEKKQNGLITEKLTFTIQGLEFTAVLLSTVEETSGSQRNYGRSIVNERVFNTVLTRARALFVAFGNPFYLLATEKASGGRRCWKEYLKRCVESNSIVFPETTTEKEKHDLFTEVFEEEAVVPTSDSILENYEKEFRQRLDFSRGHWKLIEKAADDEQQPNYTSALHAHASHYIIECKTAREAEAVPQSGSGERFIITGTKCRGQALHGAIVEVQPLTHGSSSHGKQRQGKVSCLVEQSPQRLFLCKMDPFNGHLFIPLDGKGPKLVNFPPISRRLLQDSKAVEETLGKDRKSPVACFDKRGLEKGIPRLKDVIPFEAAKNLIFLVKFIEWRKDRIYPLAAVIDIFPAAHTAFHTERMLRAAYSEMMTPPPAICIPQTRALLVKVDAEAITVDTKGTRIYDDAMSIVCKEASSTSMHFNVSVHIANVASHVPNDVTKQVVERGSAIFLDSARVMSALLPQNVIDSLSLAEGHIQPCITVSADFVFATQKPQQGPATAERSNILNDKPVVITESWIKESNVQVLKNYSFDEAQTTLNQVLAHQTPCLYTGNTCAAQLCNLHIVSRHLRKKRLGQSAVLLPCYEKESPYTVDMQAMVEEMMLWANTEVAKHLSRSSAVALLRCQPEPSGKDWKELEEQRRALCNSSDCLVAGSRAIPTVVVKAARNILCRYPIDGKCLLSTQSHYPQLMALDEEVLSTQNRASYHIQVCKDRKDRKTLPVHHSVASLYTHFTSPLWRGFDILVQKAILAMCRRTHFELSFEPKEALSNLAKQCDQKGRLSRKISKEFQQMKKAVSCFHNHQAIDTVVVSVKDKTLMVKAPTGLFALDALTVSIAALNPSKFNNDMLTWKFKIFSADPLKPITLKGLDVFGSSFSSTVKIRKVSLHSRAEEGKPVEDIHACIMPESLMLRTSQWMTVENFLTHPYAENREALLKMLSEISTAHSSTSSGVTELHDLEVAQVEVTKQVSEGSMLRVWVGSTHRGPRISTEVHVVQPVPFLSICHKHNTSPSECFSNSILQNASLDHYSSMEQYITCWEEVLLAEASQGSPSENDLTVLQNVTLNWPRMKKVNSAVDESHFIPEGTIDFSIKEQFWRQSGSWLSISTGDFICAQYDIPDATHSVLDHSQQTLLFAAPEAVRGVFHFVVAATEIIAGVGKDFSLKSIGKQNAPVSLQMQQVVSRGDIPCTLQVIPCTVSYRRLYQSLLSLQEPSPEMPLADIALGSIDLKCPKKSKFCPEKLDDFLGTHSHVLSLWSEAGEALQQKLNKEQQKAIRRAMESTFFLIQGPPGTGKSETGAHLAYAFARLNKVKHPRRCVLYCGPSNKAVNVVLDKLNKLCEHLKDFKILRIYSRTGEQVGRTGPKNIPSLYKPMKVEGCPPHLEHHTLHYKVLNGPSKERIKKFEDKFAELAEEDKLPSTDMVDDYNECKFYAELKVLKEGYDIVLCTCNEAAGERIGKHFNVAECIIDECGMAMEPESMAVIRHAEHVVLIGDHKQLQPVLQNRLAEDNGLGRSLFERYADMCEEKKVKKDGSGCFIQLKEQYRMHRQVCHFPSEHFYEGSLKSAAVTDRRYAKFCSDFPGIAQFWPWGKNWPTVFYSIEGTESSPTSTEKTRLQSRCNRREAKLISDIIVELMNVCKLKGEYVTVLTPYSAQVECIKRSLQDQCTSHKKAKDYRTASKLDLVKVQTINDSQGSEFPLVILSLVRSMPKADFEPELVRGDRSWLNEHLGFVTNPHQICVGITRSKFGLIIVGNHRLMSCDDTWNKLIQEYQRNRCMRYTR